MTVEGDSPLAFFIREKKRKEGKDTAITERAEHSGSVHAFEGDARGKRVSSEETWCRFLCDSRPDSCPCGLLPASLGDLHPLMFAERKRPANAKNLPGKLTTL